MAVNGTRAIAYGAASVQVAGSDIASGDDPSQLDTNPANLSRIAGRRADFGGVAILSGDRHSDLLGKVRYASLDIDGLDYFNPDQPFGPSTLERRYVALSFALARAW